MSEIHGKQGKETRSGSYPLKGNWHITAYYKALFGLLELSNVHLHPQIWGSHGCLSEEDAASLIQPFTIEEIDKVVKSMKPNTAPGPDGSSVSFLELFGPS